MHEEFEPFEDVDPLFYESEASLEELEKADIFEADSYLIHLMSSIK